MGRPVDPRSLTQLANLVGLSPPGLAKAISDGRCPAIPAVGAFDPIQWAQDARREIAANTRPALSNAARKQQKRLPASSRVVTEELEAQPHGGSLKRQHAEEDDGPQSLAEASRQLEWEKVREKRLKVDQDEGRLVEIVAVNAWVAGMIILARDELVRIGPELRDRLAQEVDPIECERMVADRISQTLKKLKEYQPT